MAKKTPLCRVLRTHRERLGLTLREAGEKTGVDHSFIYRIEAGISIPSITILADLVYGYGLTIQGVLQESGIR